MKNLIKMKRIYLLSWNAPATIEFLYQIVNDISFAAHGDLLAQNEQVIHKQQKSRKEECRKH